VLISGLDAGWFEKIAYHKFENCHHNSSPDFISKNPPAGKSFLKKFRCAPLDSTAADELSPLRGAQALLERPAL
jgi:hypothetical protein